MASWNAVTAKQFLVDWGRALRNSPQLFERNAFRPVLPRSSYVGWLCPPAAAERQRWCCQGGALRRARRVGAGRERHR